MLRRRRVTVFGERKGVFSVCVPPSLRRERNDMTNKTGLEFKVGDAVVYPAHGVGKVAAVEVQEVAGMAGWAVTTPSAKAS